jgi:hypothetical protein
LALAVLAEWLGLTTGQAAQTPYFLQLPQLVVVVVALTQRMV